MLIFLCLYLTNFFDFSAVQKQSLFHLGGSGFWLPQKWRMGCGGIYKLMDP